MATKTQSNKALAAEFDLSVAQADRILDWLFFNHISNQLAENGDYTVKGFGRLRVAVKPARSGVAPNGTAYDTPAEKVVRFKAYDGLNSKVK